MRRVSVMSLALFLALIPVLPSEAAPPAYPDELILRINELKDLAKQKKEMPSSLPGIRGIGTPEAEEHWKAKTGIFLDTRVRGQYDSGRIPGADWLFSDDLLSDPAAAGKLDRGREYILYCNGPRCWRAAGVALLLDHLGFRNILWYRDGFPGWQRGNLPTEKALRR